MEERVVAEFMLFFPIDETFNGIGTVQKIGMSFVAMGCCGDVADELKWLAFDRHFAIKCKAIHSRRVQQCPGVNANVEPQPCPLG